MSFFSKLSNVIGDSTLNLIIKKDKTGKLTVMAIPDANGKKESEIQNLTFCGTPEDLDVQFVELLNQGIVKTGVLTNVGDVKTPKAKTAKNEAAPQKELEIPADTEKPKAEEKAQVSEQSPATQNSVKPKREEKPVPTPEPETKVPTPTPTPEPEVSTPTPTPEPEPIAESPAPGVVDNDDDDW